MKSIVCWSKSKNGKCYLYDMDRLDNDIRMAQLGLEHVDELQSILNKCIENNSIEKVLNFKGEYLNILYLNNSYEKHMLSKYSSKHTIDKTHCKLANKNCNLTYESKKTFLQKLTNQVDTKIQLYNEDLSIIKKVQNYCSNYSGFKIHNDNCVYFKFDRDKCNSLIALYCNIENFNTMNMDSSPKPIFIFSGEGEYPFYKHTLLQLKYDTFMYPQITNYSISTSKEIKDQDIIIQLWDFQSFNPRRGHGTFILKNLEDIINKVTIKINEDLSLKKSIKLIIGTVPTTNNNSYEYLVRFYNKNGFTTICDMNLNEGNIPKMMVYKEV
ncbi:hypothetical protein CFOLD11_40690 [Clostridium folliculivorans]|uniref:Uncharacterized protein n=1 Tax=Clostridium folliculivorans TaxID=2886038 RepID=A0A9W6DCQ7_9CLOT|nr:hypothetical protein [Clostridium folliculivorans]GKU27242.1 hypothetical protein CFOLD11_40690 [Clostridium folliculivorans]